MSVAGLVEVADELYGLPLGDFTPSRDARAKVLKKDDAVLAAAVKALRKPSLAAWVVNLLVRRDAAQVEQVLQVGALLREAQQSMSGTELRALTRQRRQLTAAVTTRARGLAREEGQRVTEAVAEQVEATLTAAMLDPACGQALRSGLLVAAMSATGVDDDAAAEALALPDALGFAATAREAAEVPRPELHVVPDPDADAKALAAGRAALETAQEEHDDASAAQQEAVSHASELQARAMQVQARIDELRRRIADHEQESEEIDDELAEAQDAVGEADAVLAEAARARDEAAAAVARLEE